MVRKTFRSINSIVKCSFFKAFGLPKADRELKAFCELAIKMGAAEAKVVRRSDIVLRRWVRLKCQYGCGNYGMWLTCPPYSPKPEEMKRILKEYRWAILAKFEPKVDSDEERVKEHEIIVKLERELFLSGYYASFGLPAGPCPFCDACSLDKGCVKPELARPAMEACGIDVFATANKAGFKAKVLRNHSEQPTFFGLVLVT